MVSTDVLQAVILWAGTTAIAIITFGHFDFSWVEATRALPDGHLSIVRPADDPVLPWPGLLSAILTSVDSALNSASTLLVLDGIELHFL